MTPLSHLLSEPAVSLAGQVSTAHGPAAEFLPHRSRQEVTFLKTGPVRRTAVLNILEHPAKSILRLTLLQSGADRLTRR